MSLNCNELNRILSELDLNGSFIQEIIQSGYDSLILRCIKGGSSLKNILICTGQNACRINETRFKPPKNTKPLRFNEFLKSRVQGMRINSMEQIGLERIVKIDVSTWKEKLYIYVRLWSGASNVIVTDENGTILDCMFRRPKKGEVTGGTFLVEQKVPTEEEKSAALERFPVRKFENDDGTKKFNQLIDEFYSEHASTLSRESLLAQAEKWYTVKKTKMENALKNLEKKASDFSSAEKLKHMGDLILAFGAGFTGSTLTCTDYETGAEVHIHMDSKLSFQENAQVYYSQYKKQVSGLEELQHDISIAKKEIEKLEEEYMSIVKENNVLKIEQKLRGSSAPKQNEEKKSPGLRYEIDGWTILVGRNANENDDLLRHYVKGHDLWMHARDYSGGYVFIKARSGKSIPLDIMLYGGNLAVYHSKARKNEQADLYYTEVRYLRRAKNGPKGLVIPTQEKNLNVRIDKDRMHRLEENEKLNI